MAIVFKLLKSLKDSSIDLIITDLPCEIQSTKKIHIASQRSIF